MPAPRVIFGYHVRWMIRRDMPQVLPIEVASFSPASAWTEEYFLECLRDRPIIAMVAERGDTILGYVVYQLHDTRIELLNFAVHPAHRRQQVGSALMGKMLYKLCSHTRERLCVDVRESNDAAQLFFRSCGLIAVEIERGAYEDTGEDAYRFEIQAKACRHIFEKMFR